MIGGTWRAWTVALTAGWLASCHGPARTEREQRCQDAFASERWSDAVTACDEPGRPDLLLLVARSWRHADESGNALAAATRAFGTQVDAAARQIAGMAHEDRNEHLAAQIELEAAMLSHLALGNAREATRDAHGLVGVLLHERRLTEALDVASLCVRAAERAGDRRLLGYGMLAQAEVLTTVGDAQAARRAFVDAASVLGAWPRDAVWVLLKHGMFVLELQDAADAIELLSRALRAAQLNHVAQVVDSAELNLAVAEQMRGDAAAAQRHLDAVSGDIRASSSGRYVAARLAAERGDRGLAEQLFADAAQHAADDDYAWEISTQRGALAERAGDLAGAERHYRAAIEIVEQLRLRTATLELRPWLLARRREPYEALFELLAGQHVGDRALEVAEQLHARTWRDAVVEHAAPRARSMLPAAALAAPPLSSAELLAAVGGREALVFVTTGRTLWRIHVGGGRPISLVRMVDDAHVRIAAWRERPDDPALAEQLGALLVPGDLSPSEQPLYVVAPDLLADLPLVALRRSGRLLIDDRPVVRLPGLAALQCQARPAGSGDVVMLANVRGDLPRSGAAVEGVAPGLHARRYLGADATRARAASAQHARLLHAAVHAGVDASGGGLELADGRLTGSDILAWGLAPEIAVLAGCNTGGSRDGEGWDALPSALLVAGTRSVVATLRPVRDDDAAALTTAFYQADGARRPARALAIAQRGLARAGAGQGWMWFAAWGYAEPDECPARVAP